MAVKIYVVVVTYNGEKWIRRCLKSLESSTTPLTSIVIDNCSTDATVSIIEKEYPKTVLIKSEKNLGFGKANNLGLKAALHENCDYVFLLNQDAWIEPDTIKLLADLSQRHAEYGILSPMHLNKGKTRLDTKFAHFIFRSGNSDLLSDLLLSNSQVNDIYTIDFVNAAAWLISNDCLKTVGGFDPLFPHYGEDNDFINRATYHNFKVGFTPITSIVHDREGYLKQPDMYRSFANQYTNRLKQLKNVHFSFKGALFTCLKEEVYYATTSLLKRDIGMFLIKLRLIACILLKIKIIQESRRYCVETPTAYL